MTKYAAGQVAAFAQGAGPGGDVQIATAVALAESGGDSAALGTNSDGSRDRGLWQINDKAHPDVNDACAFDPTCNAQAAYRISSGWTDFTPWTTFQTGAYLQYMQEAATAPQAPPQRSLQGQGVVGQLVTSPWFPGQWEITQGWGPTDYDGEPEGHGYTHWHAGVDIGLDCGTTISIPASITGVARSFDNPGGYGTALVVLIDGGPGVLLGHLRQRLVGDGDHLTGGEQVAVSNNTGNSTGCHLHFEVRPQNPKQALGIDRYGTDQDPSAWLLSPAGASDAQLLAQQSSSPSIADDIVKGAQTLVAGGEVVLGAGVLVAGLVATAYGLRGKGASELQRDTGRQLRALRRSRPRRGPAAPSRPSEAAESRIRPDLQQKRPGPDIVSSRTGSARLDPRTGLPRGPR